MTGPVGLHLGEGSPLARHLDQAQALRTAAAATTRQATLLEIAYYLAGPFPDVTELAITLAGDDGRIEIQTIHSGETGEVLEWTNDGGVCSAPESYRTVEGADLRQVLDHVESLLEDLLAGDDPGQVFAPPERADTYRVALPAPEDVVRRLRTDPVAPHAGYADITSLTTALASLRGWLDEGRPPVPAARRRDRDGATAAIVTLLAALAAKLDELEDDAILRQQHLRVLHAGIGGPPRVEVVIDRDPDGRTDAAVFLDGVRSKPEITVVDPGARTPARTAWRADARYHARRASPAAAELIRAWFDAAEDGDFVTT